MFGLCDAVSAVKRTTTFPRACPDATRLIAAGVSSNANTSSMTGRIGGSDEEGVELEIDETARRIAYADVAKAIVQVEFNRPKADAAGDADDEDLVELDTASEEEV